MRLIIEPDYEKMSKWAANYVAKCINEANPTAESRLSWAAQQEVPRWACTES